MVMTSRSSAARRISDIGMDRNRSMKPRAMVIADIPGIAKSTYPSPAPCT
jgi:hypothetical protein